MNTKEHTHAINGVNGRMRARHIWPSVALWSTQTWVSESRPVSGYGKGAKLCIELRFDDNCRNGHHTFAITGEISAPGARDCVACGCLHDEARAVFPELAHLIKWHLCSTKGPMHYIANTVYHAGDRDSSKLRKGQPCHFEESVRFGNNPIAHKLKKDFSKFLQNGAPGFDFEVLPIEHVNTGGTDCDFSPKFTFSGYANKWHECPFDTEPEALNFLHALQNCKPEFLCIPTAWSNGKERQLDFARNSACWPEATDEQLCAEPGALIEALKARLPKLLADFESDMRAAGFAWTIEGQEVRQ